MKLKLEAQVIMYDDINKNVWLAVEDENGYNYIVKGVMEIEMDLVFVGSKTIAKARVCSCGAAAAKTTHSAWCDIHA